VKWREEEATRRASKKVLGLNEARRDPTPTEIAEELTSVPDYPELIVTYSKFRRSFCKCIKNRGSTQCDCTLCSYISFNMNNFNKARKGWKSFCDDNPGCCCHGNSYKDASISAESMKNFTMCQFLDDKYVNGPLSERTPQGPNNPQQLLGDLGVLLNQSGASSLEEWRERSPSYMTLIGAIPFQCYDWDCLEGNCESGRR
jgi:hypothetical protein